MKKELKKERRPLSNYEQNVLMPILIKGLEMKKGKKNAVTNNQIVRGLRGHGLKVSHRDVCSLINHIRTNDLVLGLVASSFGYYISSSEREFFDYEQSLLNREMEIKKVRISIERQRRKMFAPIQRQLF